MGSRRWAVRLSGRAAPLKHVLVQLLRNMWEDHKRGVRTRRADWWQQSENMRMLPMLPRVGSLHYLCGHCGHTGHSLLVRDGVKQRSEQNLFQPLPPLGTSHNNLLEPELRGKVGRRPKSLHSSFEPINTPLAVAPHEGRRKKRRRRTVLGAASGSSPPDHDYESLVSSPGSSCSQMQTLDVRIKVTRAVIRESGEFDTGGSDGGSDRQIRSNGGSDRGENGCSVYDNITVRDNITMNDKITVSDAQDNDSWQYTTRIPQDCLMETSWKRSSGQILSDTGQQKDQKDQENEDEEMRGTNENRNPRLKMFKLKCLNKVAS